MTIIHNLSYITVLCAELRSARYFQMAAYRNNTEGRQRADAPYFPRRVDALGLYHIAGRIQYSTGNPLDGLYTVDDFGQLVRVHLETALVRLH